LFIQAAGNLVGNALRHGDGAAVVVEAREVGSNIAQIDVIGQSIEDGGGSNYRGRFQTAGGRDGTGFGLGLSIAEQSLQVVGGRLELREDGARIEIPRGGFTG
jgi:signal transduction histidine kinase